MDFLKLVAGTASFVQQNWAQLVAGFFAVVAAATILIKTLQAFVDLFPKHQTADTVFGAILRFLADVSHTKLLNTVALTPSAPHSFMVGKRMSGVSKNFGGAASGFVRFATLLVLLVVTTFLSACAAFNGIVQKTVSCDEPNIVSGVPTALPIVIDALQGGNDWNSKLNVLAAEQGVDLVACALQAAIQVLGSNSAMVATVATVPNSVAISRGTSWLAVHTK